MNPETPYKGLLMFHGVGTGKCVLPNTNIYVDDKIMNIEKLWNKYKDIILYPDRDNGVWKILTEKIYTTSYDNKNNKIKKGLITKIYR